MEGGSLSKTKWQRWTLITGFLLYAVMILVYYKYVHVELNLYLGLFHWYPVKSNIIMYSIMMSSIPSFFLPIRATRLGDTTLLYLYSVLYIPFQVLGYHALKGDMLRYLLLSIVYLFSMLFLMIVLKFWRNQNPKVLVVLNLTRKDWQKILILLTIALITVLVSNRTLDSSVFDLSQVYVQRMLAREEAAQGLMAAYAFPLLLHGLCPLLLLSGLAFRRSSMLFLALGGILVTFLAAGTKSSLALVALLFFAAYLAARPLRDPRPTSIWPLSLAGLVSFSTASFLGWEDMWTGSILVGRLFLSPVNYSVAYFDFFRSNPYFYFSDVNGIGTTMRSLGFGQSYSNTKGFTLGAWLFGNPNTNLNVNAWANAFGDCGWVGVVGVTLVIACTIGFLDSVAQKTPRVLRLGIGFFLGFLLSETSLPGMIFGGGMVLWVPLLLMFPAKSTTPVSNRGQGATC